MGASQRGRDLESRYWERTSLAHEERKRNAQDRLVNETDSYR
jgi:hypothetical protein